MVPCATLVLRLGRTESTAVHQIEENPSHVQGGTTPFIVGTVEKLLARVFLPAVKKVIAHTLGCFH